MNIEQMKKEILNMTRVIEKSYFEDIPEFYSHAIIGEIIMEIKDKDAAVALIEKYVKGEMTPLEVGEKIETLKGGNE